MSHSQTCPDPDSTLASLALGHPSRADVLDRHHLDFCCGGKRTLRQACEEARLDLGALLHELTDAAGPARDAGQRVRWDEEHESILYPADGVSVLPTRRERTS